MVCWTLDIGIALRNITFATYKKLKLTLSIMCTVNEVEYWHFRNHPLISVENEEGKMPGGGGVLPYMAYTGTCRWTGYGFWPPLS